MIASIEAQRILAQHRGDAVVVSTMTTSRYWGQLSSSDLDLPMGGAMGKASSLGLGIALARPDRRVIVLDGDGSLLMNLGSLITIANVAPRNLVHFVFENGVYETTGGQPIPGADKISFTALARAAGYPNTYDFDDLEEFETNIEDILGKEGPTLVDVKVREDEEKPPFPTRRTVTAIPEVKEALKRSSAP